MQKSKDKSMQGKKETRTKISKKQIKQNKKKKD
jgi:hypothetical protein